MALFPQFPFSNLHELNLDWIIEQIRQIEGQGVVLSVNGLSGVVTLYTDKDVVFPDLGLEDNWQIYRLINNKVAGLKFTGEKFFYITKNVDDEEFTVHEVYTSNNQPPYPVTSVNGEDGAVRLAGDTIPFQIDGSMTIEDVITPLEESIGPVIRYNKCNKGVSAGQYVYLIGSGIVGRTDGLYKAVNSVSANTVWTAADLQIMPNGLGGLVAENDSAIASLNDKLTIEQVTDWHNFAPLSGNPNRRYGYSSSTNVPNAPLSGQNTFFGWCEGWYNYYVVHVVVHYASEPQYECAEYTCYYMNGTWTQWKRISAYPAKHYLLAPNGTCKFTLPNYGSVKLTIVGYDTTSCGEILLRRNNASLIEIDIKSVSAVAISMDSNGEVTVTSNYGYDGLVVKVEQIASTTVFG